MRESPHLSHAITDFDLALAPHRPLAISLPPSALGISVGALAVALLGGTVPAEVLGEYRALVWSLALIPALLLAHHRRWRVVTVFLAVGMAALALAPTAAFVLELPVAEWPFSLLVLAVYIALALGGGWLSEVRQAMGELRRTQERLESAYAALKESHEELEKAHLHMVRTSQLDATGQLAAGVAHEVKNPLMTLLTGVQYLKTFGGVEDEKVKVLLDDMWLAVKRADSVVRGLLDLSREQALFWKEEDPNDLVERTLCLVKHEINLHHMELVRDFENELPAVTMDSYRIQQVIINLITNSIHAMRDGGSLTIGTRRARIPLATRRSGERDRNGEDRVDGVAIVIEDTGPGIPADVFDRIFEPFFTTKGADTGTGLGLSVSQRLVRMHGGTLALENRPHGARATVLLPIHPEGSTHVREEEDSSG